MVSEYQNVLLDKNVLVVGCGGLGGYVVEYLLRLKVKRLVVVDSDVFSESNLDRQLFCCKDNIGQAKVNVAYQRAKTINPDMEVVVLQKRFDAESSNAIFSGIDVAFDCCDNVETRLLMEESAIKAGAMLVHGAINGFLGQVAIVRGGQKMLQRMFAVKPDKIQKTLSFVPAIVAGIQVNEAIKAVLEDKDALVDGKIMLIDLANNSFEIVQF